MKRRRNQLDRMMGGWSQLALCVVLDVVGALTYLIPGVGELADIVYAPIQAGFIYSMVGAEEWGMFWVVTGFVEELLPFVDIVPSCTLAWAWKYGRPANISRGITG